MLMLNQLTEEQRLTKAVVSQSRSTRRMFYSFESFLHVRTVRNKMGTIYEFLYLNGVLYVSSLQEALPLQHNTFYDRTLYNNYLTRFYCSSSYRNNRLVKHHHKPNRMSCFMQDYLNVMAMRKLVRTRQARHQMYMLTLMVRPLGRNTIQQWLPQQCYNQQANQVLDQNGVDYGSHLLICHTSSYKKRGRN